MRADYESNILPRQFLQVELEDGENKTDIHEHISKYYVENNVIFIKNILMKN